MLENAVIVVAHPDDEVLWFASIVQSVGAVIVAFQDYAAVPGLGSRRAAAMAELPYRRLICLGIDEAGSFGPANWNDPVETEFGLALDAAAETVPARQRYQQNFATLRTRLRELLPRGATVFTHNPWGEYGHEDHVQVHRVVDGLRDEMDLQMWTSPYYATRSAALASRYGGRVAAGEARPIDRDYMRAITQIYQRHDCWTWDGAWQWPHEERFLRAPLHRRPGAPAPPLTFLDCAYWIGPKGD